MALSLPVRNNFDRLDIAEVIWFAVFETDEETLGSPLVTTV